MHNRRGFASIAPFDHGEPIWRPNMPAVLSILSATLILFLVYQIPPANHALTIDIPNPQNGSGTDRWGRIYPDLSDVPGHVLGVSPSGMIMLDGQFVSIRQLRKHLEGGMMSAQEPLILFSPDANAPYAMVLQVLGAVKRSGVTHFCFDPDNLAAHKDFVSDWRHTPMRLSYLPPVETAIPARAGLGTCW